MAIFSRIKRASKAVEEPKTASVVEPARIPLSPLTISAPILSTDPTKPAHTPIDPTKPAHTYGLFPVSAEETRERIAANRKRQSDVIRRSAALSYTQTHTHSRTVSEYSLPGAGWQTHRTQEPASIKTILKTMPMHHTRLIPPPLVVRGAELPRRHSEDNAYSNPRAVPLPPQHKMQPAPPPRVRSRRLTKTKPSILLPVVHPQQGMSAIT